MYNVDSDPINSKIDNTFAIFSEESYSRGLLSGIILLLFHNSFQRRQTKCFFLYILWFSFLTNVNIYLFNVLDRLQSGFNGNFYGFKDGIVSENAYAGKLHYSYYSWKHLFTSGKKVYLHCLQLTAIRAVAYMILRKVEATYNIIVRKIFLAILKAETTH